MNIYTYAIDSVELMINNSTHSGAECRVKYSDYFLI
jgi:hypothetical protein